jgi:hypothetical protein
MYIGSNKRSNSLQNNNNNKKRSNNMNIAIPS